MENSKKKRIILLGGSLFVAFMFITSIGGFGNNNSGTQSTTTISASSGTYHVQGYVNATISGYSQDVYLNTTNLSSAGNTTVESLLQSMENNGTISNYITEPGGFYAYMSTATPYTLQEYLNKINETRNATVVAQAMVKLPTAMNLTYYSNRLYVVSPSALQPVALSPLPPPNSSIRLFVSALVVPGSTGFLVYNNGTYQMELQKA
ncbi:MAG: hypothetical protein M1500_03255 [Candidatus Marsarchaeota archaeon]|jgi:hypothetical protein|nr:hypothetical protein [Candidatus Marsarchaeota archaeon]MCL5112700.1 hypothetical protein [Candidatus Marsarchaeota archaeon]